MCSASVTCLLQESFSQPPRESVSASTAWSRCGKASAAATAPYQGSIFPALRGAAACSVPPGPSSSVPASSVPSPSSLAPATDAAYLPSHLHVTTSVADYWADVDRAFESGKLHVTFFTSPKGWATHGPAILTLVGADGAGDSGQCIFTFVPLAAGYSTRARAAADAGALSRFRCPLTTGRRAAATAHLTAVSHAYGADVALATFASAAAGSAGGVLEACPAMLLYGGYPVYGVVDTWSLSPPWRMRQALDVRVRRNGWFEAQVGGAAAAVAAAATAAWYASLGRRGEARELADARAPWRQDVGVEAGTATAVAAAGALWA
ncbi:hypothetical protein GPECTOR_43g886 [Gonium pectorale]|uniref:Uncharacterized protein n=1 Tax=Gonium pectorale TaxID=33097 RepID=A0A150GAR9_GONPE|nr:hypothetical protein GPECTOR_43g886 [Gonium pectorale]|eukprot:KXZ46450.1 hypothetical protein GPECTOR_43g886 [Gonium pectorale]